MLRSFNRFVLPCSLFALVAVNGAFAQEKKDHSRDIVIPVDIHGEVKKPKIPPAPPAAEDSASYILKNLDLSRKEDQLTYQNTISLRDMTKNVDSLVKRTYAVVAVKPLELIKGRHGFCYSMLAPITAFAEEAKNIAETLQSLEENKDIYEESKLVEYHNTDIKYFAEALLKQSQLLKNFCTMTVDADLKRIPTATEALDTVRTIRNSARANKIIFEKELLTIAEAQAKKLSENQK